MRGNAHSLLELLPNQNRILSVNEVPVMQFAFQVYLVHYSIQFRLVLFI